MLYSSVNYISTANLPINDRGLAFGDGIFTTAKVVNGAVANLDKHLQRLQKGCEHIAINGVDWLQLKNELISVAKDSPLACLKVIITAGTSQRGYSRQGSSKPSVLITLSNFPAHYERWGKKGINVGVSTVKLGLNPFLAGLKHLNRLEQVLIRNELDSFSCDDVIVTDINDHIVETNCANVYWLNNEKWYTPKLDSAGVSGIIRQKLFELESPILEVHAKLSDLNNIDAMFISNSLHGIIPVHTFNGKALNIEPVVQLTQKFNQQLQDVIDAY